MSIDRNSMIRRTASEGAIMVHQRPLLNVEEEENAQLNANLEQQFIELESGQAYGVNANLPERMTGREVFDRFSVVFSNAKEEGRSEEFLEIKRALAEVTNAPVEQGRPSLVEQICNGNLRFGSDSYAKVLRLNEALTIYYGSHKYANSSAGINRLEAVHQMRRLLNKTAEKMLEDNHVAPEKRVVAQTDKAERKAATANVIRMLKYYQKYSAKIAQNMLATNEEKLQSRWNVFKTCENDILLFLGEAKDGYDRERTYLRNEYDTLRMQITLCSLAHKKGEKNAFESAITNKIRRHAIKEMTGEEALPEQNEQKLDAGEATLNKKQEKGLAEIDAWVLRNIHNGGYMSLGLNVSDRTDFATKLLSMSKRERLFIYYLVETRERIDPHPDGFAKSQTIYEPNLKRFKKQMIANGAKFYSRFSGSYIYWGKLTEAMAIAKSAHEATILMEEIKQEEKQPPAEPVEGPLNKEEMHRKTVKKVIANLAKSIELTTAKDKTKDEAVKRQIEEQLSALTTERNSLVEEVNRIAQTLLEKKGKSKANAKSDTKTYTSVMTGDIAKTAGVVKEGVKDVFGTQTTLLAAFNKYSGLGQSGLDGLSTLMGLAFSVMDLFSNHKSMTNLDFIGGIAGAIKSVGSVGKSVGTIGQTFSKSSVFNFLASSKVASGLGYAWVGLAAFKGVSYMKDGVMRCKASMLAKLYEPDKFNKGMVKLNRVLGKKQRTNVILETVGAGSSVGISALITASVLNPSFALLTAGTVLTTSIAQRIMDAKHFAKMRSKINEAFFEMDEIMEEAEADWKAKHNNQAMPPAKKALLKKQVMKRMASELGYYSPNQLARGVAEKFAAYLLEYAIGDDEYAKMCRSMIRGLGLSYKHDEKNPENDVPAISDLVAKLCG